MGSENETMSKEESSWHSFAYIKSKLWPPGKTSLLYGGCAPTKSLRPQESDSQLSWND